MVPTRSPAIAARRLVPLPVTDVSDQRHLMKTLLVFYWPQASDQTVPVATLARAQPTPISTTNHLYCLRLPSIHVLERLAIAKAATAVAVTWAEEPPLAELPVLLAVPSAVRQAAP